MMPALGPPSDLDADELAAVVRHVIREHLGSRIGAFYVDTYGGDLAVTDVLTGARARITVGPLRRDQHEQPWEQLELEP